VQESTPSKLGT